MIRQILFYIFATLVLLSIVLSVKSQENTTTKNAIYLETLGSAAYLYNISYDRTIFIKDKNRITAALGLQVLPEFDWNADLIISASPQINYLRGENHFFESGLGFTYDIVNEEFAIPIRIGYRYQSQDKGLFFKAAITPLITKLFPNREDSLTLIMWGGIGIGYTF